MAIEKNPDDISTPIEVAKEKIQNQSQALGIDVNIKEEQEEDLAVNVDPNTGEVEIDLNEDSGKVLASISEDFYTNLADLMEEEDLEDILSMYPIDIRILGEEYRDKDFTGKDICRKRDIDLHFNKRDHRFSSSDLRRRVCE